MWAVTTAGKGAPPTPGLPDTVEDRLRDRAGVGMASRPYLFVVLEGARPLAGGARFSLEGVDEIHVGRGDARTATIDGPKGARRLTLSLPSPSLSRLHARLKRAQVGWYLEDPGSRNGSYLNG